MKTFCASAIALVALCGCGQQPSNIKGGTQTAAPVDTPQALPANAFPVPDAPTPTTSDADRPNTIDEFRSEFVRLYQKDMYAPFIELAYWGASNDEQKKEFLSHVKAVFTLNSIRPPALIESVTQLQVIPVDKFIDTQGSLMPSYPYKGNDSPQVVPEPTHILRVHAYLDPPTAKETPAAEAEAEYDADGGEDADFGEREVANNPGADDEYLPGVNLDNERGSTYENFAVGVHDGKYYFCTIKHE